MFYLALLVCSFNVASGIVYFQMEDQNAHICNIKISNLRRHMKRAHIPWYVGPTTACLDCMSNEGSVEQLNRFHGGHGRIGGVPVLNSWFLLMCGLMHFIITELGLETMADVLHFIDVEELYPQSLALFSEEECFFLREFDRRAGWKPLNNLEYCQLPPKRPSVIMHYSILVRIINMLGNTSWRKLKSLSHYALPSGFHSPPGHLVLKLGIIDSHFHLDELLGRTKLSFKVLESSAVTSYRVLYMIANYVYPSKWKFIEKQILLDPRIKFTIGLHPHMVYKQTWQGHLANLVGLTQRFPGFIGIGEVGLDFTTTCRCQKRHNKLACKMSSGGFKGGGRTRRAPPLKSGKYTIFAII